jgi:hypothetical protein
MAWTRPIWSGDRLVATASGISDERIAVVGAPL